MTCHTDAVAAASSEGPSAQSPKPTSCSDAFVANGDAEIPLARLEPNLDPAAVGRVLDGVADDVIAESARRFDPTIDDTNLPTSLGEHDVYNPRTQSAVSKGRSQPG
jgi:hypothetical protein